MPVIQYKIIRHLKACKQKIQVIMRKINKKKQTKIQNQITELELDKGNKISVIILTVFKTVVKSLSKT